MLVSQIFLGQVVLGYVGPGAGFALMSSFLAMFVTLLLSLFALLFLPFRVAKRWWRSRRVREKRKAGRVVVLGLDGFDPIIVDELIAKGKLPTFERLAEVGCFRPLATTMPAISPVAWSTFSTGVNPGKHGIFDFFTRNPANYLPELTSVKISKRKRDWTLGPLRIPRVQENIRFLRKSKSFWTILAENGVFSSVLRVPVTFPPERFYGTCLSGMCVPDLRGTQGAFTSITTQKQNEGVSSNGHHEGTIVEMKLEGDTFTCMIPGPSDCEEGGVRLSGIIQEDAGREHLNLCGRELELKVGQYSHWLRLDFPIGKWRKARGIARLLLTQLSPKPVIYVTPINIDPASPVLPISHPQLYSRALEKLFGPYATLGLAEDTWALNAGVIDENAFLAQSYDIYKERKQQTFNALDSNSDGLVISVFDTTDRIQHMMFRYRDEDHPANLGRDCSENEDAIERLYVEMDGLVEEVWSKIAQNDVFFVISDHGFQSFKWGVNLNTWLWKEGYLALRQGAVPGEADWFANVDWTRTRAYAYGLAGIFCNLSGRESQGIVKQKERRELLREIAEGLLCFEDQERCQKPIRRVCSREEVCKGPYVKKAPDLLPCFERGYRVSWNSAVGRVSESVIESNRRTWSGDHCVDPELVPGVFFCNRPVKEEDPALEDMAATIVDLFGLPKPKHQDGRVLGVET